MKKVYVFLILVHSFQFTFANDLMCASSGLTFLPKKKEISLHTMFIIEGYAMSQKTIESFKNRNVYLENKKGETVDLVLLNINKGQMSLTQAIFKPQKELNANTTYFLKVSKLSKTEKFDFYNWNSTTKKREPIYWKTTNEKNSDSLTIDLEIEFKKTDVEQYGCGPSANAIFKVKNNTKNETWYHTEVVHLETNQKTTYIIKEWNNHLNVGHGMCSGAFIFNQKGKYKVRFTPMTTDGKMNQKTKWFTFKNPHSNQKRFGI